MRLGSAVTVCHYGVERKLSCLTDGDIEASEALTCAEWVVLNAIFLGEVPMVKEMLGRGIFVGDETRRLWHPLCMASRRGRTDIA